jgi:hypothetical protein
MRTVYDGSSGTDKVNCDDFVAGLKPETEDLHGFHAGVSARKVVKMRELKALLCGGADACGFWRL